MGGGRGGVPSRLREYVGWNFRPGGWCLAFFLPAGASRFSTGGGGMATPPPTRRAPATPGAPPPPPTIGCLTAAHRPFPATPPPPMIWRSREEVFFFLDFVLCDWL